MNSTVEKMDETMTTNFESSQDTFSEMIREMQRVNANQIATDANANHNSDNDSEPPAQSPKRKKSKAVTNQKTPNPKVNNTADADHGPNA